MIEHVGSPAFCLPDQHHGPIGIRTNLDVHAIRYTGSYISKVTATGPGVPTIRLATEVDVLPMAKVHISSWRETYPGILPGSMLARLSIAQQAIHWQRMLDHPEVGSLAFVADQQGTIVGYGSCGEQRTEQLRDHGFTAEVGELYLLRCAQRRGIGTRLMRAMAGALLERGHHALSLWVLEQNTPARSFYERIGGRLTAAKRTGLSEVAYGWADLRQLATMAV